MIGRLALYVSSFSDIFLSKGANDGHLQAASRLEMDVVAGRRWALGSSRQAVDALLCRSGPNRLQVAKLRADVEFWKMTITTLPKERMRVPYM